MGQAVLDPILAPEHQRVAVVPLRSRFSAKLRRAPGNQRAPGMRSPSSSTTSPRLPFTSPYSQIDVQNSAG
jgi:hypothetical protein